MFDLWSQTQHLGTFEVPKRMARPTPIPKTKTIRNPNANANPSQNQNPSQSQSQNPGQNPGQNQNHPPPTSLPPTKPPAPMSRGVVAKRFTLPPLNTPTSVTSVVNFNFIFPVLTHYSQIIGQDMAVQKLLHFFQTRPEFNAVLLSGPCGVGKTSLALLMATHFGFEPVLIDACQYTAKQGSQMVEEIKSIVERRPLPGQRPCVAIVDNLDTICETSDAVTKELAHIWTGQGRKQKAKPHRPIICICNDAYIRPVRNLWKQTNSKHNITHIALTLVKDEPDMKNFIHRWCAERNLTVPHQHQTVLMQLARGDVRALLNLFSVCCDPFRGYRPDCLSTSMRDTFTSAWSAMGELIYRQNMVPDNTGTMIPVRMSSQTIERVLQATDIDIPYFLFTNVPSLWFQGDVAKTASQQSTVEMQTWYTNMKTHQSVTEGQQFYRQLGRFNTVAEELQTLSEWSSHLSDMAVDGIEFGGMESSQHMFQFALAMGVRHYGRNSKYRQSWKDADDWNDRSATFRFMNQDKTPAMRQTNAMPLRWPRFSYKPSKTSDSSQQFLKLITGWNSQELLCFAPLLSKAHQDLSTHPPGEETDDTTWKFDTETVLQHCQVIDIAGSR